MIYFGPAEIYLDLGRVSRKMGNSNITLEVANCSPNDVDLFVEGQEAPLLTVGAKQKATVEVAEGTTIIAKAKNGSKDSRGQRASLANDSTCSFRARADKSVMLDLRKKRTGGGQSGSWAITKIAFDPDYANTLVPADAVDAANKALTHSHLLFDGNKNVEEDEHHVNTMASHAENNGVSLEPLTQEQLDEKTAANNEHKLAMCVRGASNCFIVNGAILVAQLTNTLVSYKRNAIHWNAAKRDMVRASFSAAVNGCFCGMAFIPVVGMPLAIIGGLAWNIADCIFELSGQVATSCCPQNEAEKDFLIQKAIEHMQKEARRVFNFELDETLTEEGVKSRYRSLARHIHPDMIGRPVPQWHTLQSCLGVLLAEVTGGEVHVEPKTFLRIADAALEDI